MPKKAEFEAADVGVLEAVVDGVPNLRAVAHAVRLARKYCHYPINGPSDLLCVFELKIPSQS